MFTNLTTSFRPLAFAGAAAIAATTLAAPTAVSAQEEVYDATDYRGGAARHGLWTNGRNGGALGQQDPHFSFDYAPVIFRLDEANSIATLKGAAYNPIDDIWAQLDITFTGYVDLLPGGKTYKGGGGGSVSNADFFQAVSGSIAIDGTSYAIDGFAGNTLFQYGLGANDKVSTEFGGSAWLELQGLDNHVDLNFALAPAVPEPSTWLMLLLGFFGIGASLRHARREEGNLSAA